MPTPEEAPAQTPEERPSARLNIFKALGDNTRYAIYLELARSPRPLSTSEVAQSLGLHVNTVRPHLERMREAGLLEVEVDARGDVGRPQHRYAPAADAPSLGLEPPAFPLAARLLLRVAAASGATAEEAAEIGAEQGRDDAVRFSARSVGLAPDHLEMLVEHHSELGFDPVLAAGDDGATLAFARCPFQDLAESNPRLVCGLHRGLVVGLLEGGDWEMSAFRDFADRDRCQVDVANRARLGT